MERIIHRQKLLNSVFQVRDVMFWYARKRLRRSEKSYKVTSVTRKKDTYIYENIFCKTKTPLICARENRVTL